MSVDAQQGSLEDVSKTEGCKLDKIPTTKGNEMEEINECQQEPSLPSAQILTVTQPPMEEQWEENCEFKSGQFFSLTAFKTSLLTGYNIDEDVKKAVESGNIEDYCKDLVTRLTERAQITGTSIIARVIKMNDQVFEIVREENKLKEQGENKDGESLEAKLESLPNSSKQIAYRALASTDLERFCDCVPTEINNTELALHAQAIEYAQTTAKQVLEAAKALQGSKLDTNSSQTNKGETKLETKDLGKSAESNATSSQKDEEEAKLETKMVEKDLGKSESNATSSQMDEEEAKLETKDAEKDLGKSESHTNSSPEKEEEAKFDAKDVELVTSESNTTSSQLSLQTDKDEIKEDVEKDLVNSESDEDSEKPPIRVQEDDHVIPTPPPPPPVQPVYRDKVDEIQDNIIGYNKYQLNQLKRN
ncbi:hypothetical protein OS493_023817 [Desmophyllum pertusum]|uniref:Uncharacterized protein n=1 Tax=Desmophyllum pertusum TaxID=174260 RepID=A0A9W9YLY2_9CNID|nr:hypothetical protein OS493_023817 [Desmophyllum pertusum]